jgi:hypothetical protein
MKKIILETLVLAALAAGQAQAAPLALDQASITATYQGGGSVLGLDHDFQPVAGSNTTRLDPSDSGVEFITGDALFAFDFSKDGLLTIYNNDMPAGDGDYRFTFDFSALAAPIASFTLVDAAMVDGLPGLTVLDGHSIAIDLSRLAWNGYYASLTARIAAEDADAAVPEPAGATLLLAGAAGLALSRRRKRG